MECVYLNYLPTTKEYFYKATENCLVNLHIANTHSGSLTAVIALNVNGGSAIPIFEKSMTTGETYTLTDIALNAGMAIGGQAGTANLVSIKLDKQWK